MPASPPGYRKPDDIFTSYQEAGNEYIYALAILPDRPLLASMSIPNIEFPDFPYVRQEY